MASADHLAAVHSVVVVAVAVAVAHLAAHFAAHLAVAHLAVAHSSRSKEFDGSSLRIPFFLRAISSLHSPFPTSKSSSISTNFSL